VKNASLHEPAESADPFDRLRVVLSASKDEQPGTFRLGERCPPSLSAKTASFGEVTPEF